MIKLYLEFLPVAIFWLSCSFNRGWSQWWTVYHTDGCFDIFKGTASLYRRFRLFVEKCFFLDGLCKFRNFVGFSEILYVASLDFSMQVLATIFFCFIVDGDTFKWMLKVPWMVFKMNACFHLFCFCCAYSLFHILIVWTYSRENFFLTYFKILVYFSRLPIWCPQLSFRCMLWDTPFANCLTLFLDRWSLHLTGNCKIQMCCTSYSNVSIPGRGLPLSWRDLQG